MEMRKLTGKAAILAAAICVAAVLPSWAADGTWVGGTSTDLCEPLNWSDGVLPTDNASIGLASAGTLTCSGTFSPKSITFASNSAKVTIGGTGSITEILAITNSTANQHHQFNIPVTFAEGVEADITANSNNNYLNFAGGMTAYTIKLVGAVGSVAYYCGKITLLKEYEDWNLSYKNNIYITDSGTVLTLPGAENSGYNNFTVRNGAKLVVNGDFRLKCADHNNNTQNCIVFRIEGTPVGAVTVTGKVISSNGGHAAPFYYDTSVNGIFAVKGLVNGSSYVFMLNGYNMNQNVKRNLSTSWWIGSDGLTGNNGTESGVTMYAFHTRGNRTASYPITVNIAATDDFPIDANLSLGGYTTVRFKTTDPESGEGHVITVNSEVSGYGAMAVDGIGGIAFNNNSNTFDGGFTANDSADVVVKPGCRPGNGAVTMNGTSTLKVAQSGTVTLGGNLTLGSTAALAFNFTDKMTAPQLAIPAASTIPATVNVKISADEGIIPSSSQTHTLTSTFDFTGKTVNLVDKPKWVKSVDIVDGNLVLTVKPKGMMIIVK